NSRHIIKDIQQKNQTLIWYFSFSYSYSFVKYLGPSYVLFSGPSTKFITFSDKEILYRSTGISHFLRKFEISPSTWKKFNSWLQNVGFVPVFSLNDNERNNGLWNAKNYLSLFNLTDKLNISCIWQIESENKDKSIHEYIQDYSVLRNTIATFPNSKDNWKIGANNFTNYLIDNSSVENVRSFINQLAAVSDVGIKQTNNVQENGLSLTEIFSKIHYKYPIWNIYLHKRTPENFASAIALAIETGNAAKMGYEVLFKQVDLNERLSDTPVFWFSFLHKHLMGRNVLDVKYPHLTSDVFAYTHCTKLQSAYSKTGSITVLAINNKTKEQHISLKILGSINFRTTQIESYVLSTSNENSKDTYFNGHKILFSYINTGKFFLKPDIKHNLGFRNVEVNLPPKSIGFYVFSHARTLYCSHEEPYSAEKSIVMEFDDNQSVKLENSENALEKKVEMNDKKVAEQAIVTKITSKNNNKTTAVAKPGGIEIELSDAEINLIIKERAKNKAEKKGLTLQTEKLDKMVNYIAQNFKTVDNTIILKPVKLDQVTRNKRELKQKYDTTKKRDINMELLRKKTKEPDSNRNKAILNDSDEESSKRFPLPKKIYVEIEGDFDINKDQKKYDLFKQKFTSESSTGKRNEKLKNYFKENPNPNHSVVITPGMIRRKINENTVNNKERNFESLEVEDSSEEFFGFFEQTQPRSRFRGATFQELEEFNFSPEGRDFFKKDDDIEISFSDEISHGVHRKGSKAKTAAKIREYYKNIEELRQSKIFGRSHVNSVEDCGIDSFDFKDFDYFKRFKRDLTEYSEEDIQKYIQFMKEQLKHMRIMQKQARLRKYTSTVKTQNSNSISKSSLNLTMNYNDIRSPPKNKRHHQDSMQRLEEENDDDILLGEPLKITIGKPYESDKVKINEKQKEAQIQMLKNRLMRKKKLEKQFGSIKNDQNTVEKKTESRNNSDLSNDEDRRLATRRTLLDMWNSNPERRFARSVKQTKSDELWKQNKLYKRLTPIKEWKPQDIIKLRKKSEREDSSNWISKPTNIQFPSKSNIVHKRYRRQSETKEIDNEIKPYFELPTKPKKSKWDKTVIKKTKSKNDVIPLVEEENETTTMSNLIKSWSFYNVNELSDSGELFRQNNTQTNEKDEQVKVFVFTEDSRKYKLESDDDSKFTKNNTKQNSTHQLEKNEKKIDKQFKSANTTTNFFENMLNVFESFFDKVSIKMSDYVKKISETLTHN
ncbi:uncharacterized protein LOC108737642, partial [Agrilus planipennis]|uniref:Uncharacterized protein LOC108737642 n=1 Tax=Agrilus planipennis TaxID=224129 RepID=A0A1W4X1A6_AGRPL